MIQIPKKIRVKAGGVPEIIIVPFFMGRVSGGDGKHLSDPDLLFQGRIDGNLKRFLLFSGKGAGSLKRNRFPIETGKAAAFRIK